jgi:hypothetical protein
VDEIDFSPAQRALIDKPGSVFVPACPGAGKTQSIVERFIQRPGVPVRQGVALLSFTNAAINEARQRCDQRPDLLMAPNYVGTIDGFINRFIVTPLYKALTGSFPTFKDSWHTVQGTTFRVSGVQLEFQLGWFAFDHEGGHARLVNHQVPYAQRSTATNLEDWQLEQANASASRLARRFLASGVMDCAATRGVSLATVNGTGTSLVMTPSSATSSAPRPPRSLPPTRRGRVVGAFAADGFDFRDALNGANRFGSPPSDDPPTDEPISDPTLTGALVNEAGAKIAGASWSACCGCDG